MKVSAVIVSMDKPGVLYPCLEGMLRHNSSELDIWVVAYRYSSEHLASLKADWPQLHIVESNELRGFAENNNLALKQLDSDFVFVVNDDTLQDTAVVDRLLEDMQKLPDDVAAISPEIVFADGSVQTCGRAPWTACRWMRHYLHLVDERKRTAWSMKQGLFRTWTLNGACFLARTEVFRKAGWFDEAYTFTPEDIALGQKFNDMGYEVWVDADVCITHLAGSTVSAMEAVIKPTRVAGALHFYSKGSGFKHKLLACYVWCIEAFRRMKYAILGCRTEKDRIMKSSARNVMRYAFSRKSSKQVFTELYKEMQAE